jgi:outer membrane protein TolC
MKQFFFAVAFVSIAASPIASAITLDALFRQTLAHNAEIQKAKTELEQASGRRLVFRAVGLPDATIGSAGGDQGGYRAGSDENTPFGFGYGGILQPLFNASIPAARRRGDVELLIAEQKVNVAVSEQLHAARLAFYTALYQRSLKELRQEQRQRLTENAATQKSRYESGVADRNASVAAELQTRELDPRVEAAERAYQGARLKLAEAMGVNVKSGAALPDADGELRYRKIDVDLAQAARTALEERPDLKLARLMVRAAREEQRMIEAAYYPGINIGAAGEGIPMSGVRKEASGSPNKSDDTFSSEAREGGGYTWRVIDNGKVGGAVAQQRAARETNELLVHRMEQDVPRDLARIHNDLEAIATKQHSLMAASGSAEQSAATTRESLAAGIASQLEYRLAENSWLDVRSGLLGLAYRQNVALAEWDRALGRYLEFSDESARNVQ